MPFHDLNVAYTPDHASLSSTLLFAKELGYETVALSINVTGNLPTPTPSIPISAIARPSDLRILTRLNLTISDTAQNHRLSSLISSYDIIALRPANLKALEQCCHSLDCDIISFDFSQRLPFPLHKFTTVSSALQRGIRFEICYSAGIVNGSDARRNLISGATQLIRVARGRGIIVSSEAKNVLGLRAPWDVANLAQVWGLPQQRAKEALCEEVGKIVRLATLKRTSYRGVVDVVFGGSDPTISTKDKEVQNNSKDHVQVNQTESVAGRAKDEKRSHTSMIGGAKRKASQSLMNARTNDQSAERTPLSKTQMKKRARRARSEGNAMPDSNIVVDKVSRGLPS